MIYGDGEAVELYCDIPNAEVTPLPPGVPAGTRLRAVVTRRALTVMWVTPIGELGRTDIELAESDTADVHFQGGQAGPYLVQRGRGCSGCGPTVLARAIPFDNIVYAHREAPGQVYGLPSPHIEVTTSKYHRP